MKFVNVGFGNVVSADKIVSILSPDSAPIKRLVSEARDGGCLVDATYGRRTRAVMVTNSQYVILLALHPETIAQRLNEPDQKMSQE